MNINNEIFKDYLGYHTPSSLVRELHNNNKNKNNKIVKHFNDKFFDLRNDVNKKKFCQNENLDKAINIVKKILNFK